MNMHNTSSSIELKNRHEVDEWKEMTDGIRKGKNNR